MMAAASAARNPLVTESLGRLPQTMAAIAGGIAANVAGHSWRRPLPFRFRVLSSSREVHRRVNHQPLIHAGNRPLHS
jgi:hypothetical protein